MSKRFVIRENQTGLWAVADSEPDPLKKITNVSADTESEAWQLLSDKSGLDETALVAVTMAEAHHRQCPTCKQVMVRVSRRFGGTYLHCARVDCDYDEPTP